MMTIPNQGKPSTKQYMACGGNLINAAASLLKPPREGGKARSTDSNAVLCLESPNIYLVLWASSRVGNLFLTLSSTMGIPYLSVEPTYLLAAFGTFTWLFIF